MLIVEIDGNDGTGKTFLIDTIKRQLKLHGFDGDIKFNDRGILSKATLDNIWNTNINCNINFGDLCKFDDNTLYYLIDDFPEKCQEHILERGDSIEEEYHTMDDLIKYRSRFIALYDYYKNKITIIRKMGKEFNSNIINDIVNNILVNYSKLKDRENKN